MKNLVKLLLFLFNATDVKKVLHTSSIEIEEQKRKKTHSRHEQGDIQTGIEM
jgi:hypothetical protein